MKRACFMLAALGLAGCVSAMGPKAEQYQTRLGSPATRRARQYAPDIIIRAEHAWQDAKRSHEADRSEESSDHLNRALLLLEAAIIESQRISLEQQTAVMRKRTMEAQHSSQRDLDARQAVERETARALAAARAKSEAARALTLAETEEKRPLEASTDAVRIIQGRAELALAAATALGATEPRIMSAENSLELVRSQPSLQHAEQALRASELALADARQKQPSVSLEEVRSLIDAAQTAGFELQTSNIGVVLMLRGIFDGGSAKISPRAKRLLTRIATLAAAYPKGNLLLQLIDDSQMAQARLTQLHTALVTSGIDRQRLRTQPNKPQKDSVALVVFAAYLSP
jgi:flagellar motor protein MotB